MEVLRIYFNLFLFMFVPAVFYGTYVELTCRCAKANLYVLIFLDMLVLWYIVSKIPYWLTNRCPKHKIKKSLIWESIETNINLCPTCHDPKIAKLNNDINNALGLHKKGW